MLKLFQNSKGDARASMEKFEFEGEKNVEIFSGFVSRTKDALTTLIDNIKDNIKEYEQRIEDTTKEVSDNESSREKCEHEITKMENKIDSIKEAIENVESTYKKMVDAYASTSKGETRELYSEIIDGARANCEKDVEKNRSEIARLNSDIEAIKNNISEFTKIIDDLNKSLDNYNLELYKYNKALEYMDKISDKTAQDLEEISSKREITVKKAEGKATTKKTEPKKTASKAKEVEVEVEEEKKPRATAPKVENVVKEDKEEQPSRNSSFEDSLKQIYDFTGYTPKREEPEVAPKVEEEKTVYTDNLESLFTNEANDVEDKKEDSNFLDADISSWESMLNTPNIEPVMDNVVDRHESIEDTVNQLLNPYGTTYQRLKSITSDRIVFRNGTIIPFDMTIEDVVKAVNSIDGNDLKKMKTVGPEITLLRKIKAMKEGNL